MKEKTVAIAENKKIEMAMSSRETPLLAPNEVLTFETPLGTVVWEPIVWGFAALSPSKDTIENVLSSDEKSGVSLFR